MEKKVILICLDGVGSDLFVRPDLKLKNLRDLCNKGSFVSRLTGTFPTVTWSANTSAVTGCYPSKHGILGNSVLSRCKNKKLNYWEWETGSKELLVRTPTIYDHVSYRGGKVSAVCWPLSQGAKNIHYNIPEFYDQDHFDSYSSNGLMNALKSKNIPVDRYAKWSCDHLKGPLQDWLTKEIFHLILSEEQPDLTMVHYLLCDSFLHDFGSKSSEVSWALEYLDSLIGETMCMLNKRGLIDATDIILYSDHGHTDVHTDFFPNKYLKDVGLFIKENDRDNKFTAVSNGGTIFIYKHSEKNNTDEALELFSELPFVRRILCSDDFCKIGLADKNNLDGDYVPDLIVELIPGYVGSDNYNTDESILPSVFKSSHGYCSDYNCMDGVLIAYGPSFKKNIIIETASILDIAPTIMKIMDLPTGSMCGKSMDSIINT